MRGFIAFNFPEQLKKQLYDIQRAIKDVSNNGSWVNRANFHLTLKFLGEIDERYVENIDKVLKNISESKSQINISINSLGYFNNKNNEYKVVWAGLEGDIDDLNSIYNLLEDEMSLMGFKKEKRKFSPHITLARKVKTNLDFDEVKEKTKSYLGKENVLNNLVLMKSEVIMNRRVYTPIVSYNLIELNKNNHR